MRPSDQGHLAFIEIQLSITETCKKVSFIVLIHSAEGYVANCERINGIFLT
jgi:hypothetical protein